MSKNADYQKDNPVNRKELETIMAIWLQTNLEAHPFVAPTYWQENKAFVRAALPKATLILAEEEDQIIGFLGLMDNYIAGIFIKKAFQGKGIGQKLLQVAKEEQDVLSLAVYRKIKQLMPFIKNKALSNKSEPSMKRETKNVILFGKRSRSDISSFKACYFSENILYC